AVQQKAEKAFPKIANDKVVVCGNKKLMLGQDGTLILSNASGMIAKINPYNAFVEKASNKIEWVVFTPNVCKVKFEDGKVVWQLYKTRKDKTFKVAEQTLEVMPDGLIKLSAKFEDIDNDEIKLRGPGSFFVFVPIAGNEGRKIVCNGTLNMEISPKLSHGDWKLKKHKYAVFPDAPTDTFAVSSSKPEIANVTLFRVGKEMRFTFVFTKERTGEFYIDLRTSAAEKIDAANTGAGVDFKKIENLELPYKDKNLVFNSSFEQNRIGWKVHLGLKGHFDDNEEKWNSNPFVIAEGGIHGKHALLAKGRFSTYYHDYRHITKGANITSPTVFLNPGKYTVSFYAKQVKGKPCYFNVWNHNFNIRNSTIFLPPTDEGYKTVTPTSEWKRYSHTFTISKACPTAFSFNVNGEAEVLLDAVQVEAGTKATQYSAPAAEGLLLTSVADNFLSSKDKVNARVRVFTSPSASGKVTVRVKNFFDEVVYKATLPFKADKDGYATLALPLEKRGKGIFTVRFDFTLADGRKSFNHTRYAVVDYLNNTHRLKNIFSDDYGALEKHHLFLQILDRYRKLGFGAKAHMFTWEKRVWDKYKEYGVEPLNAVLVTSLWKPGTTKVSNFGIKYVKTPVNFANDKDLAIGDHNISNNGEMDEAYLKKFAEVTANVARKYPHIKYWLLQGEMRAKYSKEWWSKEATEEEASRRHALYLKAFIEGIHKGNPEAQVFQDDPCNMRPEGGIAETAELLDNCNKIGAKFDVIAIHPYRFSPESPDLDADAALFLKTVDAKGYSKSKVCWPEMMHWGPFEIPQWGTQSSTWGNVPRTWPGWAMSYDIGATEKLSAAWRARSWLVALKYSDRLMTATAGGTASAFHMDEELTPYCSSLMPNTLGNLLGDSKFVKDVRFAPFCRSYIFTDQKNRPVAAV
ncbi:MAG: carbohydrate binding domain-containing protein, partial [Lentisphaeria bacterium]|nr:carbohydrate binding domain-containing protein [Lentisphaeria bacterium]